ncbi:MAG: hypothetical protein Ta2D_08710 [Rickettsiales bacterium]|nr:MAG: hypothetical protein Ta2D_08710 [Rickettsiales bacterium]
MGYKILYRVSGYEVELDMCESEETPILVEKDEKNVVFNFKDLEIFLLRKKVYDMLVDANTQLPKGIHFKIFETYRPMEKQIKYWEETWAEQKALYPNESDDDLTRRCEIYIANPHTEGSGHQTGAAIDLTLCDDNGVELDMGAAYLEHSPKTRTFCQGLTAKQYENRNLLINAMLYGGFINYFEEWWHFCWGELEWAASTRVGTTKFLKLKV